MFREPQSTSNKKSICERKRCCKTCGALLCGITNDCRKRYRHTCKQIRATRHLCYMRHLKDVLPANADNVLYIFTNFRPQRTRRIPTRQKNIYLTLSACNSFARDVRKSTIVVSIVNNVAVECTHFGMIL